MARNITGQYEGRTASARPGQATMTKSRSTAAHRKAVVALAVLALACQPCGASPTALARRAISDVPTAVRLTILFLAGAVPSGTTEYTNVQIANEEWSPGTSPSFLPRNATRRPARLPGVRSSRVRGVAACPCRLLPDRGAMCVRPDERKKTSIRRRRATLRARREREVSRLLSRRATLTRIPRALSNHAETTFGNAKANLQIGVRANALNSFQDIGFGYVGNAAQHKPPAVIAYEQTSAVGETKGDLVFGTRGSTSGSTAAVEQVRIRSDGTVDVESVRFTGSQIGINGDATMIDLGTTAGMVTVNGDLKATGDLTLTKPAAAITHSGATSLSISSGGFVAVESVEFAGANIGISGDPNLMVLTSGVLTVDGKVASTTLSTTGAATLGGLVAVGGAHSDATKELYVNGDVYATGTIVSASDARFKRNVENVTHALDICRRVSAVTFSFRTELFPERRFPSTPQTGVLAHELEAVLPDLVSKDDRGFKGVAYERLGVYALAAVKELDEEVRLLRAALDAVRATLERMSDA